MNPTHQTYSELQHAYDHFNQALFAGELPPCLITLQREKRSYGYFSAKRFSNAEGVFTDEIAMNPTYFAVVPLVETAYSTRWRTRFHADGGQCSSVMADTVPR